MSKLNVGGVHSPELELDVAVGPHRAVFTEWEPADGAFAPRFAFDCETTLIRENRPAQVPDYVLGVACRGDRGVFVSRANLPAFWEAHEGCEWVFHNAPFDLAVVRKALGVRGDVYELVEAGRAWDTLILAKVLNLGENGTTAGAFSLDACAREFLGAELPKQVRDATGRDVRTGFGRYLHKPVAAIPADSLRYAAGDAVATWNLFLALRGRVRDLRLNREEVFGDPGDEALAAAWGEHGPLTHHVQLKSAILCDVMRRNGVGVHAARAEESRRIVAAEIDRVRGELVGATFGEEKVPFVAEGAGSGSSLQALLDDLHARDPSLPMRRTDLGKWKTDEEALTALTGAEPLLAKLLELRKLTKLNGAYFGPLAETGGRVHPRFWPLKNTGRMSCSGPNVQNLPRPVAGLPSVRACLTPKPGHLFLATDYAQIELCVLAAVLDRLKLGGSLADLVNGGADLHRRIAAAVLDKPEDEVTKDERQGAKAVSFGRPGGMGAASLKRQAKEAYGVELTDEEVQARIDAYETLVPELKNYLQDAADIGQRLADRLHLTPAAYADAAGGSNFNDRPAGWIGGMLLKVLREDTPTTRDGRRYTPEQIDFLWNAAAPLGGDLPAALADDLRARKPSRKLANAVERLVGRTTCTLTGRFRSNCLFTESRNTLFQGVAADGLVLALWDLWRAGYTPVLAVHDEVVLEVKGDDLTAELVADVKDRMETAMGRVVPGVRVTAEPEARRSLDKADGVKMP